MEVLSFESPWGNGYQRDYHKLVDDENRQSAKLERLQRIEFIPTTKLKVGHIELLKDLKFSPR